MTPAFPAPAWLVGCGNMAGRDGRGLARGRGRPVGRDRDPAERDAGRGRAHASPRSPTARRRASSCSGSSRRSSTRSRRAWRRTSARTRSSCRCSPESARRRLRQRFPDARAIVRAMPNLPVAERQGVTALYSEDDDDEARDLVEALMAALGLAPWCDDEAAFSAIGAVAGSGPAYVARFAAALAHGRGGARARSRAGARDRDADPGRDRGDGRRAASRWPTSRAASPAPTGRPSRGSPCSMPPAGSSSWSTRCSPPPSRAAASSPRTPPRAIDSNRPLP